METSPVSTEQANPATAREKQAAERPDSQQVRAGDAATGPAAPEQTRVEPKSRVDSSEVESALEKNGKELAFGDRRVEFSYDREIDRVVVRVRAGQSGEIVRQIPPQDYLDFLAQFREAIGLLFDEQI